VFEEIKEVNKRFAIDHIVIADDTFGLKKGKKEATLQWLVVYFQDKYIFLQKILTLAISFTNQQFSYNSSTNLAFQPSWICEHRLRKQLMQAIKI